MSSITLANSTAKSSSSTTSTTSSTTKSSATSNSSDSIQNRFLTLLTTQLKNQDPLNPVDNSQMTSQMAQISTVEGINNLNTSLQSLMTNMKASEALQASQIVGRAVLVPGTGIQVIEGQGAGGIQLTGDADKVMVTIKDSSGKVVQSMDLGTVPAGVREFVWDGKDADGNAVEDGTYTVSVEASLNGKAVKASPLQLTTINSVITGGSQIELDAGLLGRITLDDVKLIL